MGHLATRQLHSHLLGNQAFIVSHKNRHFVVSCPIAPVPLVDQLIAMLYEVTNEEHLLWMSRTPNLMPRSCEGPKMHQRAKLKVVEHEQPDLTELRDEIQKRRRVNDSFNFEFHFKEDLLVEFISQSTCQCTQAVPDQGLS